MKNDKRNIGRDPHIAPGVYYIQQELCARIDGDRIIVEKKESEDERIIEGFRKLLNGIRRKGGVTLNLVPIEKCEAYLEKQKEQKPAEWSEEDELNIGWLIAYLKGESAGEYYDEMMRESLVDWLKSLKNRGNFPKSNTNSPSWKPSEEQMEALLWCTAHLGGADHRVLAELYEHLRKLREE